jgi:hypothetical protein
MSTKIHTINRGYNLEALPKVGEAIEISAAYPLMHDDYGNAHFFVLHSVHVDDGILQVIGDADNGWYEWVWFTAPSAPKHCATKMGGIHHTRAGFGMASYCLFNGLAYAFGAQVGYGVPVHEAA